VLEEVFEEELPPNPPQPERIRDIQLKPQTRENRIIDIGLDISWRAPAFTTSAFSMVLAKRELPCLARKARPKSFSPSLGQELAQSNGSGFGAVL
jgi:hypothetical protein